MSLVDQQPVAHMMDEDEVLITADQLPAPIATTTEASDKPDFGPLSAKELQDKRNEFRRVRVPPHRLSPLKRDWLKIYSPIVEHLLLQVRMNPKTRMIEIRTCDETLDAGAVQKAADFVRAYCLGFSPEDSLALLRMDDLFLDTFEVKD
ncbi:pre-rRNA-processing protein pno1, partial [Coemansia sp. D1744]